MAGYVIFVSIPDDADSSVNQCVCRGSSRSRWYCAMFLRFYLALFFRRSIFSLSAGGCHLSCCCFYSSIRVLVCACVLSWSCDNNYTYNFEGKILFFGGGGGIV